MEIINLANKLCFIVTDAISFNVLYRSQLEYLVDNGCDLTLICGGDIVDINQLRARKVGKVIDYGLVRKPSIFLDSLSLIKLAAHFSSNRYDLVLSTTPKALLLGSIATFLTMQPRRVSFFQGRVYENFGGLKRNIFVFLDYIVVTLSSEIIFVSNSLMSEFIQDIPNTAKKGIVVGDGSGNGVCSEKFSLDSVCADKLLEIRNTLKIKEANFVVLSVGRICEDKGLKEIVEVANLVIEQTSNVHFIMLGNIEDDNAFDEFSELIKDGVMTHIDFVDDITPYLAISDVHLFLSHREGFGNVAIEAAAMEVPTIAFDVVGIKDSVEDSVSGLRFKFGDSESVANSILNFVQKPDEMRKKFEGSRGWVIEKFEQRKVWKNYLNFYLQNS